MSGEIHFIGVGGSGMRGLAYLLALRGRGVTGSDRTYDREPERPLFQSLIQAGVKLTPQDGSGVHALLDRVVISTAVEETVPDLAEARRLGVPVQHRSELLAEIAHAAPALIALAGTSGKTTTAAMVAAVLEQAGLDPLLLNGGATLGGTAPPGLAGVRAGTGPAVIEADESDGSLVRYHPTVSAFITLDWDHKPLPEVRRLFLQLASQTRDRVILGLDSPGIQATPWTGPILSTGEVSGAELPVSLEAEEGWDQRLLLAGRSLKLGLPGRHNARNAAVAAGAARALGIAWEDILAGLASFRGVHRRLERLGTARGVTVVDDFAHNPEKLAATLATLRPLARRILAVFQPHGFGPTRFLADRLVDALAGGLTPDDRLHLPEIYYAGGTAVKDISSADLVQALRRRGVQAEFQQDRQAIPALLAAQAEPGDVAVVMGARDDGLTVLARSILEELQ